MRRSARSKGAGWSDAAAQESPPLAPPRELEVRRFTAGPHEFAVFEWPVAEARLPETLSAAEAEVVALVIEGLSNAGIARRRRTSVRTVANQLAVVFRKLGVGSRHELAATLVGRAGAPHR